jgi:hypothetical protein
MLLAENPYRDSTPRCYATDLWFPRTYPLKGEYNDYGSVEKYTEGPLSELWLRGLRYDVVEKGWGDNRCHDVPVAKDMTFDALLDAIWEDRVQVSRNTKIPTIRDRLWETVENLRKEAGLPKINNFAEECDQGKYISPVGDPSLQRIQLTLKEAGLPIVDKAFGTGFLVDEEHYRSVRVRWSGYGAEEQIAKLTEAQKHLSAYATLLSAGSNFDVELLVRPLPGVKDAQGHQMSRSKREQQATPLTLSMAMIREDVWQALVKRGKNMKLMFESQDKTDYTAAVHKAWNDTRKALSLNSFTELDSVLPRGNFNAVDRSGQYTPGNHVIGTTGWGSQWELLAMTPDLPDDVVAEFLNTVVESLHVQSVLTMTRYWWRPSYSIGPQFGEPALHAAVLSDFAKIARAEHKRWNEDS